MSSRTKKAALASLIGLAAVAPAPLAQWDSVPHVSSNPVYDEGFLVAHDDGTSLQAFSALTQSFLAVTGTGATVHGTGDWTLLGQDADKYIAYSARHHAVAPLTVAANFVALDVRVEDDVALVVGQTPAGFRAHAYSAQTNTWSTLIPGGAPADVVSSRFVIGLRDGATLWGFAARTGTWAPFAGGNVAPPVADGNVLTFERLVMNDRRQIAFSGVLGTWSLSPILMPGTSIDTDHNVAYGYERLGMNLVAPTGFSAYTGAWVTSPFALNPVDVIQTVIADNVVVVERNVAPHWEAIGARPQVWAPLNDPNAILQQVRETLVLVGDGATLWAYGGLFGAFWAPTPYNAPLGYVSTSEKHLVLQDAANDLLGFSPAANAWAPVVNLPAASFHEGDAITAAETLVDRWVYSARNNVWSVGPVKLALPYVEGMSDSAFASQLTAAIGAAPMQVYNERRNVWNGSLSTGGIVATWYGDRNVLIADTTGAGGLLYGYSAQRGDLAAAAGGLVAPLKDDPAVEENVAWVVDDTDTLWAFGSALDTHAWYAWPNGSEYQTPSPPGGGPIVAHEVTIEGPGGGFAWIGYSLTPDFGGLVVPGVGGSLHLGLPVLFTLFLGAIPTDGLLDFVLPIPPGAPVGFELWVQALTLDAAFNLDWTEPAPEPAFLF